MRLWSLHPQHLDPAGLVALWREALLAQAVLNELTRGYKQHPQLQRFREHAAPRAAIATYLHAVADEADARGYKFDRAKVLQPRGAIAIVVTSGQLRFEWEHLRAKLRERNPQWLSTGEPRAHPSFAVVPGEVATWERAAAARSS